jgi:hypothetical protein
MSTMQVVLIVLAIIVVAAIVAGAWYAARSRALRKQFGPEYDRLVTQESGRFAAERELRDRQRRHSALELHELTAEERERFTAEWEAVQVEFVDSPTEAALKAEDLITRLVSARGYPTDDYDEQLAQLSVEHSAALAEYRDAHDISERGANSEASTEQLRQAMVRYRTMIAELLGEQPVTQHGVDHAVTQR